MVVPERRKALCFTRDVYYLICHKISELPLLIAVKLYHVISICIKFIMQVQKFGALP